MLTKNQNKSRKNLENLFKKMIEDDKIKYDRPPPKGYLYHCKHCTLGTNCSDGICVGCAFY